ncbi:uncharacterized protein LOC144072935 isoform X2 [Stigmatopora argus]
MQRIRSSTSTDCWETSRMWPKQPKKEQLVDAITSCLSANLVQSRCSYSRVSRTMHTLEGRGDWAKVHGDVESLEDQVIFPGCPLEDDASSLNSALRHTKHALFRQTHMYFIWIKIEMR